MKLLRSTDGENRKGRYRNKNFRKEGGIKIFLTELEKN
jgi:hypothetical protein